jgi:hypothetical protein
MDRLAHSHVHDSYDMDAPGKFHHANDEDQLAFSPCGSDFKAFFEKKR